MRLLTKGDDTSVIDFGLDERRTIKVHLRANLNVYVAVSRLIIIESTGAGLHVTADTVVVAGTVTIKVVEAVKSNSVFGGIVAYSSGIAGNIAAADVVRGLSTNQETVTAEDSISSESGSLYTKKSNY